MINTLDSKKIINFSAIIVFATTLWMMAPPVGLQENAWHLFIIFVSTIGSLILKPLPMGALTLLGMVACVVTNTLSLKQALSSFNSPIIWLVLAAFMIARGFIKTGLGPRVAYIFVTLMGKDIRGLAYGIGLTELFLAPFVPSNTARGAGIIYPIVQAISKEYEQDVHVPGKRTIGAYLVKFAYQANLVTSAMFITALAGNPIAAEFASKFGVELSWMTWAVAACVPGLLHLFLLPLVLYYIFPPVITKTPEAPILAKRKLTEMGPLSLHEIIMLGTFMLLLVLWVGGSYFNIAPATAALLGVAVLLVTDVLKWDDFLKEHNAWNAFVWLSILLMMANYLADFGMIQWFSNHISDFVRPFSSWTAFIIVSLIYFYSGYFFASVSAHISSMYGAFLAVTVAVNAPPAVVAMTLAAFSSLSAGITHYGTGSAPVYFGSGYLSVRQWWTIGFALSFLSLLMWMGVGLVWWKLIGLW